MKQPRKFNVECSGAVATVEIAGSGPDVVMVGSAVPMAWTRPTSEAIAELGFRVTNFDYAPIPDVDPTPRTCVDQVTDVLDVMDAVGASNGAFIGMSRGAITAYELAASHPSRTSALVLGFPVAGFADLLDGPLEAEPESDGEGPRDPLPDIDLALDEMFSPSFLSTHRQDARDLVTTPPGSVVRVHRHQEKPVSSERISAPTLIVSGGKDYVVAAINPQLLKAAIPHASTHFFDDAYHGFIMEEPNQFATVVADFVGSHTGIS